ncbi:MAG: nucleotidyltransferase domain-containing protein [Nitrospirales bacterium]
MGWTHDHTCFEEQSARYPSGCTLAWSVAGARVFGSHAAGRARRTSDEALLITLQSDRDLMDLVEFKLDVQDLPGCDVDVVTEKGLSPHLRRTIPRTSKPL